MQYQFPLDLEQRVQAQMQSGLFNNEDDVLREAIGTLEKRQKGLREVQEMVREADIDIAAGRVGMFDSDATKQAVRQQLANRGISN